VVKSKKLNLAKVLEEIVAHHPTIGPRFKGAERVGDIRGYGLPLGSKVRPVSGDHYMLVGDAGHLIDPLTGEGIGNALYSGFIAAEQAAQCLARQKFDAAFLKAYDVRVQRVLGSEMQLSYRMQKAGAYPVLLNFLAFVISGNQKVIDYFSGMYTDLQLREQLINPWFWMKMLMGGKKRRAGNQP
jgi:flavin-dependent dehydrogenase